MQTIEIITFLVIFIAIVLYSCYNINKEEKLLEKEKSKRNALEAENTEFDYGHNVNLKNNIKEIHFYLDCRSFHCDNGNAYCYTYDSTKRMIKDGFPKIHTTSIANISFDLLDLGYRIFVHRNGKTLECKLGSMDGTEKEIRREHNILKMIMGHVFDDYFNV